MVSQNKPFVFINYSVSDTITATENELRHPCLHRYVFHKYRILKNINGDIDIIYAFSMRRFVLIISMIAFPW